MADKRGGYQRPTATNWITDTYQGHRNRPVPSKEPGTDYGAAYGSTLFAPEDGTVVDIKTSTSDATGRFITIDFTDGQRGRAIHLSAIGVSVGQKVKRGQAIGKTGASAWGKEWGVGAHVHQTLWDFHGYRFGRDATIDFEAQVGADNDGSGAFEQVVADRQNYLNAAQGEKLVVDGVFVDTLPDGSEGRTKSAIKRYQQYLAGRGWYSGEIDGYWGNGTQAGHEKRYAEFVAETTPKPNPALHTATVADLKSLPNTRGLQKIAKLYGYTGGLDNDFGGGSQAGLQKFLDRNHGGSLAAWLRSKWGYADHDDLWGPNMAAAATRADTANWREL